MPIELEGPSGARRAELVEGITLSGGSGPSFDADAAAFFAASGVTDATQRSAVDTLVIGLKDEGLWAKCDALYPFVGGTAATHKWNLKDPRDLDAAFRLLFIGGLTHSANGMVGNGTTGYADTRLAPATALTVHNTHMSFYSRTDNAVGVEMGVYDDGTHRWWMSASFVAAGGNIIGDSYADVDRISVPQADARGFYVSSRTANNAYNIYRNAASVGNFGLVASGTLPTRTMKICAEDIAGVISNFSSKQLAFVSIGDGLSALEVTAFNSLVQAFQTTLGRNV